MFRDHSVGIRDQVVPEIEFAWQSQCFALLLFRVTPDCAQGLLLIQGSLLTGLEGPYRVLETKPWSAACKEV